jgi:L-alanine-DL-glutamate epimerase-like enolase superfamily enzyme
MHITRVNADLLQLPLPRPRCLPRAEQSGSSPEYVTVLLVVLDTDEGLTGLGFAYDCEAVRFHGRILRTVVEDALAPQLIGADPRSYERLYTQLRRNVTPGGNAALAAVDIGVWDLAAKAAGLPLWRFLGGARDAATAYTAETAWPTLGGEQIVALYEAAKANGISGLQVAVGGLSPEADARRLESIRNEIGLDAWLGVSANGVYDAGTALAMGRFLEEEMDADWFEDPVPTDDRAGLRRLADKLEMPVAAGRGFERVSQFTDWLTDAAAGVLRPIRFGSAA